MVDEDTPTESILVCGGVSCMNLFDVSMVWTDCIPIASSLVGLQSPLGLFAPQQLHCVEVVPRDDES